MALNCLTAPDFRIAALGSMVKGAFTSHSIFVSRSLKHKTTHSKICYRKYLSLSINTSVHVFLIQLLIYPVFLTSNAVWTTSLAAHMLKSKNSGTEISTCGRTALIGTSNDPSLRNTFHILDMINTH